MRLYDVEQNKGGELVDSGQEPVDDKDKFKELKNKLSKLQFAS